MEGDHSIAPGRLGFGGHSKQREARMPHSFADSLGANVRRKLDLVVKEHWHDAESLGRGSSWKEVRSWEEEDCVPTFGHYDNRNIFQACSIMRATALTW